MIDWHRIAALPWKARNAETMRAARELLSCQPRGTVLSSMELAERLFPAPGYDKLAQLLARMAPHAGLAFASHDGEEIVRYGRKWRRWRWHGQA